MGSRTRTAEPAPALDAEPATDPLARTPQNPDELHAWIAEHLNIRIARVPLIEHHAAPFDYLCHAFFEGAFSGAAGAPAEAGAPLPSPDCIVWANRGGGKTYLGAIATLLDLLFKPGCQVRILAGSVEQGRRMHDHLRDFLERESFAHVKRRITARRITLTRTRSAVEILAASQTSVRGTRVQKLRCDEVDLFDSALWSAAQLVTRSLPRVPGPWGPAVRASVEALSTMHKPFGLMWDLVGDPNLSDSERRPSRLLFRWGLLDVLEHCPPERDCAVCPLEPECRGRAKLTPVASEGHISIDDAVGMKFRVGRATWDSEMLCLRPSRSGSVYAEFDSRVHVHHVPQGPGGLLPFAYMIAGMDFGYRSESVILLAGVTSRGGVHILREHCVCKQILATQIDALDRWREEGLFRFRTEPGEPPPLEFIGIDPAGNAHDPHTGKRSSQMLNERGYNPRSRKSEIQDGISLVRDRLDPAWVPPRAAWGPSLYRGDAHDPPLTGTPRLTIDPCCTRLIECLTRYHYKQSQPESLEPEKDGFDHACDALRYMILNLDRPQLASCDSHL